MDWQQLLNERGAALLLYARQWTNSEADAEDALQDGLLRFWRAWQDRSEKIEKPVAYCYTCVKRSALDRIRSSGRRTAREIKAAEDLYDRVPMFESGLEADERRKDIEAALQRLPDEQREVLVLRIWGELTFKQIGEVMGTPHNTAAARYRYALAVLERILKGRGYGNGNDA
jgi:RNA polymerase sigma-70 factor (ECF subfamily)